MMLAMIWRRPTVVSIESSDSAVGGNARRVLYSGVENITRPLEDVLTVDVLPQQGEYEEQQSASHYR